MSTLTYEPQWDEWGPNGTYYYKEESQNQQMPIPLVQVPQPQASQPQYQYQYPVQPVQQPMQQIQQQHTVPQGPQVQQVQQVPQLQVQVHAPMPVQQLQQVPQVQQVQQVQPVQSQQPYMMVSQPAMQQPEMVYGYYYPFAYAPRMQPTSLPSPRLEGTYEDYEEGAMVEFLAQSAYQIMSNGTNMWSETEIDSFQRFVQGVIRSTRLSKHTILLSLQYLNHRWSLGNYPDPRDCDYDMYYLMFVVSLALANKVHDDNTFTNASWFQATGIPAAQITKAEAHWLAALNWDFDIRSSTQWLQWHDRYQSFLYHRSQRSPTTPPGIWAPSYTQVAAF